MQRGGRLRTEPLEAKVLLAADIVINEIHYDTVDKTEPVEYVELFNTGDTSADLSSWSLADGISYTFPLATQLAPGGYLVISQDPQAVQEKFGVDSLGPFQGKLSNDRDTLLLIDANGQTRDEVTYRLGFPWPTVGETTANSIELVNPRLDNDLGGNWRPSVGPPTPGAANSQLADNVGPQMRQVKHTPQQPRSGEPVTITVKITDPDGVSAVTLDYQIVAPGDYISINDPRYQTSWTTLVMRDDGTAGDSEARDSIYTVVVAGQEQQHRRLVRYRVNADDGQGARVRGPYQDDPVPNFAYFVYDGVPDWEGSPQPGVEPSVTYSADVLESVQTYQLITTRQSHADSQQLPDAIAAPYFDSDYPWDGALVFDGQVYDHIRYRARGGDRYRRGKNPWKFDFNRGHDFQARDNYGNKYDAKWRRLNFSSTQRGSPTYYGEQGLHEAVGFALFGLAGVPSSNTNFVSFRIIENADEQGTNQYDTDFNGLYLAIEQHDGRFLDERGLPDGNLFKMRQSRLRGTANNQGPTQPPAATDLLDFASGVLSRTVTDEWLNENIDVEKFYRYRTIVEGIHHYDTGAHNNLLYHNPDTDLWAILPWDLDFTWQNDTPGSSNDPFSLTLLRRESFLPGYRNTSRDLRDLLFNSEQTGMLIDEIAGFISTPGQPSFVDANSSLWDRNPATNVKGRYYERAPETKFAGMVQLMKDYVVQRSDWIDANVLTDEDLIPETPTITYAGDPNFALNGLNYEVTPLSSPVGSSFSAIEWRIAEVTDPRSPEFDPSQPRKYEINAVWESGELDRFSDRMEIQGQDLQAGRTYRVRARIRDDAGRWSHWSDPHQLVAGAASGPTVEQLRITELNYHPQDPSQNSPFEDNDFEFIEFQNTGSQRLDITGLRIEDGVDFTFVSPPSSLLNASFRTDADGLTYADDTFEGTENPDKADGQFSADGGLTDGGLQILLGPGDQVDPITLLETSFAGGPDGFTFATDTFNQTENPNVVSSGADGDAVSISLGPGDTGGPSSGAWQAEFELPESARISIDLTYNMTIGPGFESTEFGEVILQIDGVSYGNNTNGTIARLAGKGQTSTEIVTESVSVVLGAGPHTLSLGAFNNQATDPDEFVDVVFHDVVVTIPEPGAIGPTSAAWSKVFNVFAEGDVQIALDYRMVLGDGLEADEFGEIIVEVDGTRIGRDVGDSLVRRAGGTEERDTGWNSALFNLPQLDAGQHVITLGAISNEATAGDEFVQVYFDNLSIDLFENVLLGPGESTLVVNNRTAFESRYGSDRNIAGEYSSGKLSNGGEQIRVRERRGGIVQEFTYNDRNGWPREADGQGKTLEVIDTSGDYDNPINWRASLDVGGTPAPRPTIIGDVTGDGLFNSSDLVQVLAAGEFEDDVAGNSTFAEGDWDGDGDFTTADLVLALQSGLYNLGAAALKLPLEPAYRDRVAVDHVFDGELDDVWN